MQPATHNLLAASLQSNSAFLTQLGKACLSLITDEIAITKIKDPQFKQVGYIITQVILGKGFPQTDLSDRSMPDSYLIIKITGGWVKATLCCTSERIEKLSPALDATIELAKAKGEKVDSEVPVVKVFPNIHGQTVTLLNTPETKSEIESMRAELFRKMVMGLVNSPKTWHCQFKQLCILSHIEGFERYIAAVQTVGNTYENDRKAFDTPNCIEQITRIYASMLQDLAKAFGN